MAQRHVSDIPLTGSIESTLRQSATMGIVSAGHLIGVVSGISAISTTNAKRHVSERPFGIAAIEAVKKITPNINGTSTLVEGGSLADVYSAISEGGDWAPGFGASM